MKKLVAALMLLIFTLAGCSSNNSLKNHDSIVCPHCGEQFGTYETIGSDNPSKDENQSNDIVIIDQQATGTEYGYSYADFTVKNNSAQKIHTLTLNIKILDKQSVVISTTHPQDPVVLDPGESIVIEAMAEEGAYSMKLDGYSFYTGTDFDGEYIQGHFSDTKEVILN